MAIKISNNRHTTGQTIFIRCERPSIIGDILRKNALDAGARLAKFIGFKNYWANSLLVLRIIY